MFINRASPAAANFSPVFGDLGGLPPTLVQASEVEMLLDDSWRYVNKARASGSPVQLQTWNHVMHVGHFFHRDLPEAQEAFAQIEQFLNSNRTATVKAAA